MRCPYCMKEMTDGYIFGQYLERLKWAPRKTEYSLGIWAKGAVAVLDSKQDVLEINAHRCMECKVLILPMENDK